MYAAPFENDNDEINNNSTISTCNDEFATRKKNVHNKTYKKINVAETSPKVNSFLNSIHSSSGSNAESGLADFNPIPPPSSMGVENTKLRENMQNLNGSDLNEIHPLEKDIVDLQTLKNNYLNDKAVEQYYKHLIPTYKEKPLGPGEYNKQYYQPTSSQNGESQYLDNHQVLLNKLNYMINLLEEQQDEKTNNVTEEVVLYSFLGIFIIYIVDSFARVGKYTR